MDPARRSRGQSLFLTPVVFKFASVLALSAVAVAPGLPPLVARGLAAAIGIVGVLNLGGVSWGLVAGRWPGRLHWSDPLCYGVFPTLAFAGLAAAAALPDDVDAARGLGAAGLVLLLLSVRNAWDLVTAISGGPAAGGGQSPPGDAA
jgi:hypothetical protein